MMTFGAPIWFWALLVSPVLALFFARAEQRGVVRLRAFVSPRLLPQLAATVNRGRRLLRFCLLMLGLALAIAPVGAWIAQTGRIDLAPMVLAAGVICWVTGFDLIYATQDFDFDRRQGIRSLVIKLGITRSLRLAQLLHLLTFAALIGFGLVAKLGALYYWSMPLIAAALVYEHKIQKLDLAGINRAFFQSNAFVSAVFLVAVCVDRLS